MAQQSRPSTISHHPLSDRLAATICLRLSLPRYPSAHPRRKSAQALPIITRHLRLSGHVQHLERHLPLVQHTRHPPAGPSVQSELNPIIRSSGELPRAGCYFQPDGGKLERGMSVRRNACCARTHLAVSPLVQCVYQQSLPCQPFYVNRPFLILESPIIGSPNARCVI